MAKTKMPENLLERLVPVLLFASIALAFVVGILWQKVNSLESGGSVAGTETAQGAGTNNQQAPDTEGPTTGKLPEEQAGKVPEVAEGDHVRGNRNAQAFVIAYSDFECPFCSRFHPTTNQILEEYGDKVAIVYRHFPLDQIHPKARPAAVASECVAELGGNDAFWRFADDIFENQATALNDFGKTAGNIGVNASALQNCIDSQKYDNNIQEEYTAAVEAGVRGTPGNFVVNQKGEVWFLPGAYPFEQFKTAIDEALQS